MSVYKHKRTSAWEYDFQMEGQRFTGPIPGCSNQRAAETFERDLKAKKRRELDKTKGVSNAPVTIKTAIARFCGEHEKDSGIEYTRIDGEKIVEFFSSYKRSDGKTISLLADLDDEAMAALVAWRKGHYRWNNPKYGPVKAQTVNHSTTVLLRRVTRRAVKAYGVEMKKMPNWTDHMLKVANRRTRRIEDHEHADILSTIDPEYAYLMQFALVTGIRKTGSLLKWENVDFKANKYRYQNKGDRAEDGDELKEKTLTPAAAAILRSRMGHHPVWVFTYIAKRTHPHLGTIRGRRYPITVSGLNSHWKRLTAELEIRGLWWHDLRRSFASHLLKTTGNLRLVQLALDHASSTTTERYAYVEDSAMVSAMAESEDRFASKFDIPAQIEYHPAAVNKDS